MHDSGSIDSDEVDEGCRTASVVSDIIFKKPGRPENETPTELLERVAREVKISCQHSLVQPSYDAERRVDSMSTKCDDGGPGSWGSARLATHW